MCAFLEHRRWNSGTMTTEAIRRMTSLPLDEINDALKCWQAQKTLRHTDNMVTDGPEFIDFDHLNPLCRKEHLKMISSLARLSHAMVD